MINKRILTILICIALSTPATLLNLKANETYESLDRVVAIVEKSVVTKRELEKAINVILVKLKKKKTTNTKSKYFNNRSIKSSN